MGRMRKFAETIDPDERELADQIDREVQAVNGLLALALCLSITIGLLVVGAVSLAGAI